MFKSILYINLLVVAVLSLSSCEKVIDVQLDTSPNQVVIEGNITDQPGQKTIRISQSVPYTEKNVYPPVTGAAVTVTDDAGHSWNFTETQPGSYTSAPFAGEPGRTYTMKVNVNNTVYTALSTMPAPVKLDSLSFKVVAFGGDESKQAEVHYQDPQAKANQYRYIMKVNNVQIKRIFVENDRFTDGNAVTSVLFNGGDDEEDLKPGDNVEIEMQCIDQSLFTYWFTLSQQTQNGPGGGVTPGNPPSNINNQALGYFSAHTTEKKTIKVE